MAIKLLTINGKPNERVVKYIVDTEDEKVMMSESFTNNNQENETDEN